MEENNVILLNTEAAIKPMLTDEEEKFVFFLSEQIVNVTTSQQYEKSN